MHSRRQAGVRSKRRGWVLFGLFPSVVLLFKLYGCVPKHRDVKVACWVLRSGDNSLEEQQATLAITQNWGSHCSVLEFIDSTTEGIVADWKEGYDGLAGKSLRGWQYMYDKQITNKSHVFDFVLKADLDSFILWENLQSYLRGFSGMDHHYIGKRLIRQDVSLVAGGCIILSKATLDLFVKQSRLSHGYCDRTQFLLEKAEDVALARCLAESNIFPHDARDNSGAERFMVFDPTFMMTGGEKGKFPPWYYEFSDNTIVGPACCSSEAIAFHNITLLQQSRQLVFRGTHWEWA